MDFDSYSFIAMKRKGEVWKYFVHLKAKGEHKYNKQEIYCLLCFKQKITPVKVNKNVYN